MNKAVIITGGAKGIGKQIALDFLQQGDIVTIIDKENKLSKDFNKYKENLFFYHGDVAKEDTLKALYTFALDKMKKVDILINNACIGNKGILSNTDYSGFDYVLSVGLKAPYELSRLCKEELIKNKGHIINIGSSRAFQSEPDSEAYAAAKGGIVALTHALAISLAPHVTVNCIAPGWINTTENEDFSKEDKEAIPMGRVGTPKDVSSMVMYLTQGNFITGETLTLDGGMSKRMIYHGENNWIYNS